MADLDRELQKARGEVERLVARQEELPSERARAGVAGDGGRYVKLSDEADALPLLLRAAQLRLLKLEIEVETERLQEIDTRISETFKVREQLEAEAKAVNERFAVADAAWGEARYVKGQVASHLRELARKRDELARDIERPLPPVVRSGWQASSR